MPMLARLPTSIKLPTNLFLSCTFLRVGSRWHVSATVLAIHKGGFSGSRCSSGALLQHLRRRPLESGSYTTRAEMQSAPDSQLRQACLPLTHCAAHTVFPQDQGQPHNHYKHAHNNNP